MASQNPVDVRCRDAVLPEQPGCQVGAFDLEPLLPGGAGAQPEIVHYAGGEQQLLVVGGVGGAAVLAGEQPGEEERANAVVGDERAFGPLREGQGGAGKPPVWQGKDLIHADTVGTGRDPGKWP